MVVGRLHLEPGRDPGRGRALGVVGADHVGQGTLLVSSAGTYLQGDGGDGQWTEVSTSPAVGDSSIAYDAGDGQVVLFGGICATCGADAVPYTWTWDGDWTLRDSTAATATPPAAPYGR